MASDANNTQHAVPVDKIPYIDNPDLKINKNESTQMPFRYVKGEDGQPIMPQVRQPSHNPSFSSDFLLTPSLPAGYDRSHHQGLRKEPRRPLVGIAYVDGMVISRPQRQQFVP